MLKKILGSEEEGALDGNTVVIGLGLICTKGINARFGFGGGDGGDSVCWEGGGEVTVWWEGDRWGSVMWGGEGGVLVSWGWRGGGESCGGIGGGSVSEVSGGKVSFSVSSILREKKIEGVCCWFQTRRRGRGRVL